MPTNGLRQQMPLLLIYMPELIVKYGYPLESHTVRTEDGYILTLHRIPYGRKSSSRTKRSPVLVQHGMRSSSEDWVVMGPEKGLGYILADAGYDVWLGNARGNKWCNKHVTLSPFQSKFWQFSWHEMGVYDLPAMIDYILEKTGEQKLFYIGYSMGTTMFFVMASEKPEYNSKIRVMYGLAPVAYITDPTLKALAYTENLFGPMIELIISHDPTGMSTETLMHCAQVINSGKFRQYNHGFLKNLFLYGSAVPPQYDLNKITAPVALMCGQNDFVVAPKDVAKLKEELPNVVTYYKVKNVSFNHKDFMLNKNAKSLLYDVLVSNMQKH